MAEPENTIDPRHPHEPEVLPILDDEGRCLVCVALVAAREEGWEAGVAAVRRQPVWLLTGDLEWLEFAVADYVWRWGQHLPGVHPDGIAGTPVAVANMAMTVIRKNIRRIEPQRGGQGGDGTALDAPLPDRGQSALAVPDAVPSDSEPSDHLTRWYARHSRG